MSKYTAEEIKAAASTVQSMRWHADEGEEMMRVANMLREYAAHLAAQAEWPSEEDVARACRAYNKAMGIPAVPSGFATPHMMRAALQCARPPVGVVSIPDGYALVPKEAGDADAFMVYNAYMQPCRTRKDAYKIAIAELASRHAPAAPTKN